MSEHTPVMGPACIYRLTSPDTKALGRYARLRLVFATRMEAERTMAALLCRTPGADIRLEEARTLDPTGHILPSDQREWRLA
jgi:hypothetical protein